MYGQHQKRPSYGNYNASDPKKSRFDNNYSDNQTSGSRQGAQRGQTSKQGTDDNQYDTTTSQGSYGSNFPRKTQFGDTYYPDQSTNVQRSQHVHRSFQSEDDTQYGMESSQLPYYMSANREPASDSYYLDKPSNRQKEQGEKMYENRLGFQRFEQQSQQRSAPSENAYAADSTGRGYRTPQNRQGPQTGTAQQPVHINFDLLRKAKQSVDKMIGRRALPGDKEVDSEVDRSQKQGVDEYLQHQGAINRLGRESERGMYSKSGSESSQENKPQQSTLNLALKILAKSGLASKAIQKEHQKLGRDKGSTFIDPFLQQNSEKFSESTNEQYSFQNADSKSNISHFNYEHFARGKQNKPVQSYGINQPTELKNKWPQQEKELKNWNDPHKGPTEPYYHESQSQQGMKKGLNKPPENKGGQMGLNLVSKNFPVGESLVDRVYGKFSQNTQSQSYKRDQGLAGKGKQPQKKTENKISAHQKASFQKQVQKSVTNQPWNKKGQVEQSSASQTAFPKGQTTDSTGKRPMNFQNTNLQPETVQRLEKTTFNSASESSHQKRLYPQNHVANQTRLLESRQTQPWIKNRQNISRNPSFQQGMEKAKPGRSENKKGQIGWESTVHTPLEMEQSLADRNYEPLKFQKSHLKTSNSEKRIGVTTEKQKQRFENKDTSQQSVSQSGTSEYYDPLNFLKSQLRSSDPEKQMNAQSFGSEKGMTFSADSRDNGFENLNFQKSHLKTSDSEKKMGITTVKQNQYFENKNTSQQSVSQSGTSESYDPLNFLKSQLRSSDPEKQMNAQSFASEKGMTLSADSQRDNGFKNMNTNQPLNVEAENSDSYDPLNFLKSHLHATEKTQNVPTSQGKTLSKRKMERLLRTVKNIPLHGKVQPLVPDLPDYEERKKPRGNITPLLPDYMERKKPNTKKPKENLETSSVAQKIKRFSLYLQSIPININSIQTMDNAKDGSGLNLDVEYFKEDIMKIKHFTIMTGWLTLGRVFIFRSIGDSKRPLKHFVYDKALEILKTKSIVDILSCEDIGVDGIKKEFCEALQTESSSRAALNKIAGPEMAKKLTMPEMKAVIKYVDVKKTKPGPKPSLNFCTPGRKDGIEVLQSYALYKFSHKTNCTIGDVYRLLHISGCLLPHSVDSQYLYQKGGSPPLIYRVVFSLDNVPVSVGEDIFHKEAKVYCFQNFMKNIREMTCDQLKKGISLDDGREIVEVPSNRDGKLSIEEKFKKLIEFVQKTSFSPHNIVACADKVFKHLDLKTWLVYRSSQEKKNLFVICDLYLEERLITSGEEKDRRLSQKDAYEKVWPVLATSVPSELLKNKQIQQKDMEGPGVQYVHKKKLNGPDKLTAPPRPKPVKSPIIIVEYDKWSENREKQAFCILKHSATLANIDFELLCEKALLSLKGSKTRTAHKAFIKMDEEIMGSGYGENKEDAKNQAAVDALFKLYETTPTIQIIVDSQRDEKNWHTYDDIVKKSKTIGADHQEKTKEGENQPADVEAIVGTAQVCLDLVENIAKTETLDELIFAPDLPAKERLQIVHSVKGKDKLKSEIRYSKGSPYTVVYWKNLSPTEILDLLKNSKSSDVSRYRCIPKSELPCRPQLELDDKKDTDFPVFQSDICIRPSIEEEEAVSQGSNVGLKSPELIDSDLSDGSISCGDEIEDSDESVEHYVSDVDETPVSCEEAEGKSDEEYLSDVMSISDYRDGSVSCGDEFEFSDADV